MQLYDEDGDSISITTTSFTLTAYFDVPDPVPDMAFVRNRIRWFQNNLGVDGDGYTHVVYYVASVSGGCVPENLTLSTPQYLYFYPAVYFRLVKYKTVGISCDTVILAQWFWSDNTIEAETTCDLADLETPSPVSISDGGGSGPGIAFDYEIITGSGGDDTDGCLHEACEGASGGQGGSPAWACCDSGADWFCSPDTTPETMTGAFTSGPCNGTAVAVTKSSFIQNGVERGAWTIAIDISGVYNLYLSCDGTVYSQSGVYGVTSIGSVTTTHSCNPLDFEVTLTGGVPNSLCGGPCGAGAIIRITE